MGKIRVGLIGIGNCASAIVQSVLLSKKKGIIEGLLYPEIAGYKISDIEFTLAIDVDRRKIGKDLTQAIFEGSNIFPKLDDYSPIGVTVQPGPVLDGVAEHMEAYFQPHDKKIEIDDIARLVKDTETEILVNMIPVGSEQATRAYAEAAIRGGAAFINGIPVFIASDPTGYWPKRFFDAGLPVLGDDVKGQFGATILHSALTSLMRDRGIIVEETYQLNVGGNTDFLNMKMEERLSSKRISKTKAVTATLDNGDRYIYDGKVRIGPSDYVPFLGNTKVAYIYVKGRSLLGFPVELDVKLKVDDKSMFAAVMLDVIRLAKLSLDRGLRGPIHEASAYYFKHPPKPVRSPLEARILLEQFITGKQRNTVIENIVSYTQ